MQYSYKLRLTSPTKPIDLFKGESKIGILQGSYKNIWTKMFDYFILKNSTFIRFEIKDSNHNHRLTSSSVTKLGNKKVKIIYTPSKNEKTELVIKDSKMFDIGDEATFEYNENTFVIKKPSLKPAKLLLNNHLIAEWKDYHLNRTVTLDIFNYDYIQDEYLILGIFHCYFYTIDR
ncbi:tubby C-terminal domain-like protein [Gracilibacillus halophilus]|uniref:tubby C-terminal domain-like protein n=1 Tax=Gracilibacillus halophilus TaxID=470864 RepID=UPI003B835EFF